MDDMIAAMLAARKILDAAPVEIPRFCFVSAHTFKMLKDKRYRGRMIRRGKIGKKEAKLYARVP